MSNVFQGADDRYYEEAEGVAIREVRWIDGQIEIEVYVNGSSPLRPVRSCDCCGRFDVEPIIARSVEEAVELGWLVPQ